MVQQTAMVSRRLAQGLRLPLQPRAAVSAQAQVRKVWTRSLAIRAFAPRLQSPETFLGRIDACNARASSSSSSSRRGFSSKPDEKAPEAGEKDSDVAAASGEAVAKEQTPPAEGDQPEPASTKKAGADEDLAAAASE